MVDAVPVTCRQNCSTSCNTGTMRATRVHRSHHDHSHAPAHIPPALASTNSVAKYDFTNVRPDYTNPYGPIPSYYELSHPPKLTHEQYMIRAYRDCLRTVTWQFHYWQDRRQENMDKLKAMVYPLSNQFLISISVSPTST